MAFESRESTVISVRGTTEMRRVIILRRRFPERLNFVPERSKPFEVAFATP